MTRGDVLQLVGAPALAVGLFVLFGVGWTLLVLGVMLVVAGELADRWSK